MMFVIIFLIIHLPVEQQNITETWPNLDETMPLFMNLHESLDVREHYLL